jgi:hypothetical protein
LADKKGNEDDPLFNTKFVKIVAEKYQPKNIFSNPPTQKKFEESIGETENNIGLLREGFNLKYKGNKKIDWLTSFKEYTKKDKNRTKTQQEEDFGKLTNYLEREYNPFIRSHINWFSSLTSLKELNQWTHILAEKQVIA